MQWVARADLATLDFPAADADLIELLTQGPRATGNGPQTAGHGRRATDLGPPATE
jgi:hypothetical protein